MCNNCSKLCLLQHHYSSSRHLTKSRETSFSIFRSFHSFFLDPSALYLSLSSTSLLLPLLIFTFQCKIFISFSLFSNVLNSLFSYFTFLFYFQSFSFTLIHFLHLICPVFNPFLTSFFLIFQLSLFSFLFFPLLFLIFFHSFLSNPSLSLSLSRVSIPFHLKFFSSSFPSINM